MPASPVLVWLRRDLRTADHAALRAAASTGHPVLPVFVLEEGLEPARGGASRWWLHHSLASLRNDLRELGLPLALLRGDAGGQLAELCRKTGADAVHWHRRYEPGAAAMDESVAERLRGQGVEVTSHAGALLVEPGGIRTGQGGPYQVFTPYSKNFAGNVHPEQPADAPESVKAADLPDDSLPLEALELLPSIDWAGGLRDRWKPGAAGAMQRLESFLDGAMAKYGEQRDLPDRESTSALSPHLHWGEISPRTVWHAAREADRKTAGPFLRQLVWREFAHDLLHHFPRTVDRPLREQFESFPWDGDPELLPAWQKGETGYPIVDAGMRQLWATGWMHNRVRMVAASFLVKHLLLPWQLGAEWFRDTLVDADLANNTFGWQWTAGCGADAAPYFRIFNPMTQGRKFDPRGEYVRRWVPELRKLPNKSIHEPWKAAPMDLAAAGVKLGSDYPRPVVDHGAARERALESYRRMQAG